MMGKKYQINFFLILGIICLLVASLDSMKDFSGILWIFAFGIFATSSVLAFKNYRNGRKELALED